MKKSLLKLLMSLLMIMTATVTASAQCYILGNDNNWQTNKAGAELQKTDNEGVYEGEVTFDPNAQYFTIVTKLTEGSADWDVLREYRYGPAKNNLTIIQKQLLAKWMLRFRCQAKVLIVFVSTSRQ